MDEEKVFHLGLVCAIAVIVISTSLQVFHRTQDRVRRRVRADIVRTQQIAAESQARFSSLVQPEILRSVAAEIYPKIEAIGFNKSISALDIKLTETDKTE